MNRSYSDRVMRFRRGVYANRGRITPGCQVLLLRLSEEMNPNAIVSIPRSKLAAEFACAPARITEWMNQAKDEGFLSVVRRARPGVTAVYQGLYVAPEVREGVPTPEVRKPGPLLVREGVPLIGVQRYARAVPQEVVGIGTSDRGADGDVWQQREADCSDDADRAAGGPHDC